MSLFENLSEALKPHTDKLSNDAAFHMAALHAKLGSIERAVFDLQRGDIGNKWQRFQIKRKFAEGENFEVGTCPINEIWLIQAIAADGVQEKSPAFVILSNGVLIESVIKEGLGFEGVGGNQAVFSGEILSITARAEGSINCVITVIRRPLPVPPIMTDYGKGTERFSPKAIHNPERDEIQAKLDTVYESREPAIAATEGREG